MRQYALWFLRQMKIVRTQVLIRIVAGLTQVGFGLLLVWLCRRFIDDVIWKGDIVRETIVLFAVIALLIGLRQVVYYYSNMAEVIEQNAIRQRLFGLVLGRRMYADDHVLHSGDVSQRLDRDIAEVVKITTSVLPGMVVTLVQLVGAFFLMHSIDSVLAWSLLVLTPVVVVSAKYLSHRLKQMTLDIRQEESRIQMLIQETVEHELTIKSLQGEKTVAGRVGRMQQKLQRLIARRVRFTLISRLLISLTFSFGYFGAFVYGAIQLRHGLITFGVMTAFLQLVNQIQSPIMTLLGMIPQLIHSAASVDRLQDIERMEQEQEMLLPNEDAMTPPLGIRLTEVSYHYPHAKEQILSTFSYDFLPATSTALLGETGRGKTTLLRLLSGVLTPQEGSVELYDQAGHLVKGTDMRRYIIYITQGNTLMSGSIRENLLLAHEDASEEEMRQALHAAMADFVFQLPQGLDTLIGEHATRLSEGQAQRIAIARGLLRKGCVMLLDEVSSALDVKTEKELFDRMFSAYPNRTIICVTHRPEAAERCREVLKI